MQTDATFCGQCGFNLQAEAPAAASLEETAVGSLPDMSLEEISLSGEMPVAATDPDLMSETAISSPIEASPWDDEDDYSENNQTAAQMSGLPTGFSDVEPAESGFDTNSYDTVSEGESLDLDLDLAAPKTEVETIETVREPDYAVEMEEDLTPVIAAPSMRGVSGATQLQIQNASLLHLQSNTTIEIPDDLDVVHFGKPNGQIPPDIDVSGFPDSEVVSRVHADLRIEGDAYFIEDMGSSNGTYINHSPLQKGNRHRLRNGDRIALGKGDLVTFIFQIS